MLVIYKMANVDFLNYGNNFLLNNPLSIDNINKKKIINSKLPQLIISNAGCGGDDDDDNKYSFTNNLDFLKLKKNTQDTNTQLFNFFFSK